MNSAKVYLTSEEVAERLRTTPSTVRHWRQVKKGPPCFRLAKRVLYDLELLEAWEQARQQEQYAAAAGAV